MLKYSTIIDHIYYRAIRYLNRYITYTPEYIKDISLASFVERASAYRDYPYVLGADGTNREIGIDCSHLISRALIDAGSMNPYFYRTAHYLKNLTHKVTLSEISPGCLLFLYEPDGTIGHVAIVLEYLEDTHALRIFDASGPSSGVWSTIERVIPIPDARYTIGWLYYIDQ